MQQLAGILNEETKYTDEQITAALKQASISPVTELGNDWVISINGIPRISRSEKEDVDYLLKKMIEKNILPGAELKVEKG